MNMVTALELGYKAGEMDVGENASYRTLRPQFQSILTPADILRKQFEELNELPKNRKWKKENIGPWNTHYFDTSMGVAGTADELILNPNSPALAEVTSETPLVSYGIPMKSVPETAQRFQRSDYADHINRPLEESEVAENPFWLVVAEDNKDFLGRLAQLKFKAMKDVYKYNDGMGFYFPEDAQVIERSLVLGRFNYRAVAGGNNGLDYYSRVVGVRRSVVVDASADVRERSEALASSTSTPREATPAVVRAYTPADLEAAQTELGRLREVVRDERLASLESLLRKLQNP